MPGRLTEFEKQIFDYTFEQAYRYGRWTAMEETKPQPVGNTDKSQLRTTAAIAAMQGLIAHRETFRDAPFNDIPKMAEIMADLLINELDKTKEQC